MQKVDSDSHSYITLTNYQVDRHLIVFKSCKIFKWLTLVYRLVVQEFPDLVGRASARAGNDGEVGLDPDFRVQLTVLHEVKSGLLEL